MKRGAAEVDVAWGRDTTLNIEVAKGNVETLEVAESIGLGLRLILSDGRMGFAYSSDPDVDVEGLAESAHQNALGTDPDSCNVLPTDSGSSEEDWSEEDFDEIPVAEKIALCVDLERKTLDADKRISLVQQAGYSDTRGEAVVVNSRGLWRRFRSANCSCSVVAAASENGADSEMGWEFDFSTKFKSLRPEWVADRCASKTCALLGGKVCSGGPMPVVLDDYVTSEFLQVLGPALMATNVIKGKSLFRDSVGSSIASRHVRLVDQNDLPRAMNRAPFDAEGSLAQKTVLVEEGVLKGFLHNAYTARKMGLKTTANAGRGGGYRSVPEVVPTNFFLEPGTHRQEELLETAGSGLFVVRAMGVHMANPISGDFSLGVSGYLIRSGKLDRPVRGVTVAGNLKDFLAKIEAVGNDLRFFGAYGAPSVLVADMVVSGE